MTDSTSILPGNLSELELELDAALARIEEVEIPISVLWNPWECPLTALPYLAWAMSVDQWRSGWTEQVKRQVIANSLAVHRRKGTRPAVEQALAALGIETEFTEWFEASPRAQPGTFELIAWVNENLTDDDAQFLSQALYDEIRTGVNSAKNARSHFTFKVGAKFSPKTLGVASAISGIGAMATVEASAYQEPIKTIGVACAASSINTTGMAYRETKVSIDTSIPSLSIAMTGTLRCYSVIHTRMEAIT